MIFKSKFLIRKWEFVLENKIKEPFINRYLHTDKTTLLLQHIKQNFPKMNQVYLYGAGGHAKVVLDILKLNGIIVPEIFDDNPNVKSFMGIPVSHEDVCFPLLISIGSNSVRKNIAGRFGSSAEYSSAVRSKQAIISETVVMGEGTVVMQNVVIQSSVKIGKHCIINTKASIDHDCMIRDYVHIAPGAILCGNVEIGEGSFIGAGTTVIPGVKIGKWSVIGAGAVVVKDIPDYALAYGNPCKCKNMLIRGGGKCLIHNELVFSMLFILFLTVKKGRNR
jgi:acetyltransferase EpsM